MVQAFVLIQLLGLLEDFLSRTPSNLLATNAPKKLTMITEDVTFSRKPANKILLARLSPMQPNLISSEVDLFHLVVMKFDLPKFGLLVLNWNKTSCPEDFTPAASLGQTIFWILWRNCPEKSFPKQSAIFLSSPKLPRTFQCPRTILAESESHRVCVVAPPGRPYHTPAKPRKEHRSISKVGILEKSLEIEVVKS